MEETQKAESFSFFQTSTLALMSTAHLSGSARRTVHMKHAACVLTTAGPTYQDPVCTANGTTYDNKCWHELSYCRGLDNNLVYHPGSCEGW